MDKQYVFAGNRAYVFDRMMKLGIRCVKIFAMANSYFERYLIQNQFDYVPITGKEEFIRQLHETNFHRFISNGLPIILPISELKSNTQKEFINIHPSLLPDLRGADPVPGSLLYQKDSGATCHYMDDGIDTGDIIAQIKIENSPDLDAGLLYQLSFLAEADVFEKAYARDFKVLKKQIRSASDIYYTISKNDMIIDLKNDTVEQVLARVKAFSTKSKGAVLQLGDKSIRVYQADVVTNPYMINILPRYSELAMMFEYENYIIIKKDGHCLRFKLA